MTYQLLTYESKTSFNQAVPSMTAARWEVHTIWIAPDVPGVAVLWQRKELDGRR